MSLLSKLFSNRPCDNCFGRGFTVVTTTEIDDDGIEYASTETQPCKKCNANGKAPFDQEVDGDYDI